MPVISAIPILVWLLVQLGALSLAAARIRLAAHYPEPAEFQAVRVMLAVQFACSAILFPTLCRSCKMGLATAASGWVMLLFAAGLAAWPLPQVAVPGAYLTLWIASLVLWHMALPRHRWRMIASSLAALYVVGGPLLWYVALDLGNPPRHSSPAMFGPLTAILINPSRPGLAGWISLIAICGCAGLVFLAARAFAPTTSRH